MSVEVLVGQKWLNSTYGGNPNYLHVNETGLPGTAMSEALVSALQTELGLSSVTGSFGGQTSAACDSNPLSVGSSGNRVKIMQYGLYSKGYDAKAADGNFTSDLTLPAIREIQLDAGLIGSQILDTVKGLQMKAILGVDEYKKVSRGDTRIREMQQSLNNKYLSYTGLRACDGVYSRSTNTALIFALQAEEKLPVGVANGNFGPTTIRCCPDIPYTGVKKNYNGSTYNDTSITTFIKLAQYILYCIGHDPYTSWPLGNGSNYDPGTFNGLFNDATKTALHNFQRDVALPIRDKIGIDEWMALLLSTGNPNRNATACDCATKINTPERAQAIIDDDYSIVGRYLTGIVYQNGVAVSKALDRIEMETIFSAGLRLFVIYQDAKDWYNANPSEIDLHNYFDYEQGIIDARKAVAAAWELGIPQDEYIYFAVDYDFMQFEVEEMIVPYFQGINDYADSSFMPYKIGIYGSRNTCSIVSKEGLATSSFVSDLSTGYSGNMGFPLPSNWTFDQIKEYNLYCSTGNFAIDKDVASGRYIGFNTIARQGYIQPEIPVVPSDAVHILSLIDNIRELEDLYLECYPIQYNGPDYVAPTALSQSIGVLNFLRTPKYNDESYQGNPNTIPIWEVSLGRPANWQFHDYVKINNAELYNELMGYITGDDILLTDGLGGLIDLGHLAATTEGYCTPTLVPDFWTGWGGDLATGMADTSNRYNNPNYTGKTIQEVADMTIGSMDSSCNYTDLCTDIDACRLSKYIKDDVNSNLYSLSTAISWYYNGPSNVRFNYYPEEINSQSTLEGLADKIFDRMTDSFEDAPFGLLDQKAGDATEDIQRACCNSMANYIYKMIKF